MNEIWKDIPFYEGKYQVSNLGRVKSFIKKEPKILNQSHDKNNYCTLSLSGSPKKVHRLVLLAFVGHSELTVDHINGDKRDNRLENLEYVTNRENIRRNRSKGRMLGSVKGKIEGKYRASVRFNGVGYDLGHFPTPEEAQKAFLSATEESCKALIKARADKKTSKYTGVTWVESQKKWCAKRTFNGRCYNLGSFVDEKEAADFYSNATEEIALDLLKYRQDKKSSQYEGISYRKSSNKWHARYKDFHIGYFTSESEAYNARAKYLENIGLGRTYS